MPTQSLCGFSGLAFEERRQWVTRTQMQGWCYVLEHGQPGQSLVWIQVQVQVQVQVQHQTEMPEMPKMPKKFQGPQCDFVAV
jgi:hypothetical protein